MERLDLNGELERRLHAARPGTAVVDEAACDGALLARLRALPVAPRRRLPRAAAPAAVGVAAVATAIAAVMLGGPSDVGGPSSASAITQALRWFSPPHGTILHVRSVETQAGRTTVRELWQSADHPAQARELVGGGSAYEVSGDEVYDPAANAVYVDPGVAAPAVGSARKHAVVAAAAAAGVVGLGAADPAVAKTRILLQEGRMHVAGRGLHDGVDAWAISLDADAGRPVWTLWVSAADGRPLELRDPGRDASEPAQTIRWQAYDVVKADAASARLLSVTGAHPGARVVRGAAARAAIDRLLPAKR